MGILRGHIKVGDSRNKPIVDIIGNHVNDGTLVVIEMARVGVQRIDSEIAVVDSGPTPVEIELAVALTIAAANKSVT